MTRRRLQALATSLALIAALAAGCGGSKDPEPGPGIPAATAKRINQELDLIRDRIRVTREDRAPGSCGDIELKSYPAIEQLLDGVPKDTDPDKLRALTQSVDRLRQLTDRECKDLAEEIRDEQDDQDPTTTQDPLTTEETVPTETEETVPTETETQTQPRPPRRDPAEQTPSAPGRGDGPGNGNAAPGQEGGADAPAPKRDGN